MSKPSTLFKAPKVSVHTLPPAADGSTAAEAVAFFGEQAVMLDADAAEVLVDYLRVIRAYFSYGKPKELLLFVYQKTAAELVEILENAGRTIANHDDVKQLIQHLGCLHEWAQWDLALQHPQE
ncbi:hypothetical protein D770_02145 [Flammeovirgaceae bacterium 311]|nr:hypothetical protein D770_02145 [Flammeovirgaceae bacterium 311]